MVSKQAILFCTVASLVCVGFQLRAQTPTALDDIAAIADASKCGTALGGVPLSYLRGVATVFARATCEPDRDDVEVASAARSDAGRTDALAWYEPEFAAATMPNDSAGLATLRHVYTLLLGLGVRESSGRYCVGRDRTAPFDGADSAEAGLFQTSWGAHATSDVLAPLFQHYADDPEPCLLGLFSHHVSCSRWDARTWGEGEGAAWQQLTKACPTFATEYAAVLLRTSGGSHGEFGPLRRKQAKIMPECDRMLSKVQAYTEAHPQACAALQ